MEKINSETEEATGHLIGDIIVDKITRIASDKPKSAADFMLMKLNDQ